MENKRRILLVLTRPLDPTRGGVQMSTWKMAEWFAGQGHEVAVFSSSRVGHVAQSFAHMYVGAERSVGFSPESGTLLAEALGDFSPDVVINQMPYDWPVGNVLATHNDFVLIGCLRNTLFATKQNIDEYGRQVLPSWAQAFAKNALGRRALLEVHRSKHKRELQRILGTYDRFVMFGPPNLDELRYFVGNFDSDKVGLIPNSVPSVLDEVPPKEKRILWLGRLEHKQKRAGTVLPIWERLSKELPDWHLDIVGDGPAMSCLVNRVEELGLERVTFHGRQVPDDYYRRAPIFMMTSAWEGFPNTIVEAQSFGAVPVLFDSFPVASWMVTDGKNGFLIQPYDINAIAQKVIDLARGDDLPTLAAAALENARRFHIDSVGRKWESLFDALLSERLVVTE